jgi:hypothetical protein
MGCSVQLAFGEEDRGEGRGWKEKKGSHSTNEEAVASEL